MLFPMPDWYIIRRSRANLSVSCISSMIDSEWEVVRFAPLSPSASANAEREARNCRGPN